MEQLDTCLFCCHVYFLNSLQVDCTLQSCNYLVSLPLLKICSYLYSLISELATCIVSKFESVCHIGGIVLIYNLLSLMPHAGVSPVCSSPKMAASVNSESAPNVAKFHPKCGEGVKLRKNRRTASGYGLGLCVAFSNGPIPNEFKFSVKVLLDCLFTFVSPISAASIRHTLDAPYMAGGAVHVILCCLFFV